MIGLYGKIEHGFSWVYLRKINENGVALTPTLKDSFIYKIKIFPFYNTSKLQHQGLTTFVYVPYLRGKFFVYKEQFG